MIRSLPALYRAARSTLQGNDSPTALAGGVAGGMLIGLIPPDSLIVPVLVLVVMATTANLFTATVSAILFSWVAYSCDDLLHRIGAYILTLPSLQQGLTLASDAPILPWTRFNNPVVCGATVLGIGLLYPIHFVSEIAFRRLSPIIHRRLIAWKLYRAWLGIPDLATDSVPANPLVDSGASS